MSKFILISPSGNLYGSEQVLIDYLRETTLDYSIVVPKQSELYAKIKSFYPSKKIATFNPKNVKSFYVSLFIKLLFKQAKTVYINEAGHCKYILLLAKIFSQKKFVIHVRIIEDTSENRWNIKAKNNVTVLVISKYLQNSLNVSSILVNDPYKSTNNLLAQKKIEAQKLIIGVIGRITHTKGFLRYIDLLESMKVDDEQQQFQFRFYGNFVEDISDEQKQQLCSYTNVEIMGFEQNISAIYSSIDCVMHLSTQEGLGRIILEAVDFYKPFIGINAAGVGEVAANLGLVQYLVSSNNIVEESIEKLTQIQANYSEWQLPIVAKKEQMLQMYSASSYNKTIDSLISLVNK